MQLYQALHPEDTETTEEDLKTITLEPIFLKDITNDLGFSVKDKLFILVEAQSTASVNILIRSFMYLARTYQEYLEETKQNLYGSKPVKLPKPELYVIFSCDTNTDKEVWTLSEEFFGGDETAIEVRVNVITDKNGKGIIGQYIIFTKVLDMQRKTLGNTEEAIINTIKICKNENILKDFLQEHEKEVYNIMISLYNQEKIYEMFERELIAEGEAQSLEKVALEMLKNGFESSMISTITQLSLEKINEIKSRLTNNIQLAGD
ncbi:MAG: hypothetical protein LUG66_06490 [Clostridiales bacterium]|nr:hypothetical protein [Clostridiales bacterium]